mmetsp:Transcript_24871/g.63470  ORF Transcript_24871/g.63470 Transcript_24871/m.63470 type:complete len:208 (+) Transcript_24871:95-718(+)
MPSPGSTKRLTVVLSSVQRDNPRGPRHKQEGVHKLRYLTALPPATVALPSNGTVTREDSVSTSSTTSCATQDPHRSRRVPRTPLEGLGDLDPARRAGAAFRFFPGDIGPRIPESVLLAPGRADSLSVGLIPPPAVRVSRSSALRAFCDLLDIQPGSVVAIGGVTGAVRVSRCCEARLFNDDWRCTPGLRPAACARLAASPSSFLNCT